MGAVGMQALRETGNCHRRFALAVELVEARPEYLQRALQISHIHRPTAVIDRAQVAEVRGADLGRVDESGQHRRGGEHGDLPVPLQRDVGVVALARK